METSPKAPFIAAHGSPPEAEADAVGLELCDFFVERAWDCDQCKTPRIGDRVWVRMSGGEAEFYECNACAAKRIAETAAWESENDEAE